MLHNLFNKSQRSYSTKDIDILRLIRSENVGPRNFFSLLRLFGDPALAIDKIPELSMRGGRSQPIKIYSKNDAYKELELLEKNNAHIITYDSLEYSKLLLQIPDAPPILSYKGNIGLLNQKRCIGVVGSRNASINGIHLTQKIVKDLVHQNYIVVSGLARGIDTAAHKVSPSNTIAVIAGGIDHIYPYENKKLYEQIANDGLLIAELPIGSKPLGKHFPQRNRLISGLTLGTLVIEAGLQSGSLITARCALEQNRELFVVPGFPRDPRCMGSNKLLKEGAHLVESAEDVINNLPNYEVMTESLEEISSNDNAFKGAKSYDISKVDDEMRMQVLQLLSATPVEFNYIMESAKLPLQVMYTIILELELAGKILRHQGNKFSLILSN